MRILTNYYTPNFQARRAGAQISREKIEKLLGEGMSTKEIAKICNVSDSYLSAVIKKMGIKSYKERKRDKNVDTAVEMFLNGHTRGQIGEELGYTRESITRFVKCGWDKVKEQLGEVENSRQIKMQLKKAAIQKDREQGMSVAEIAEKNGLSVKTIRRYLYDGPVNKNIDGLASKLLDSLNENITLYESAERLGISFYTAKNILASKFGIKDIKEYHTKVITSKVASLRELGKSVREIAKILHVTEETAKKYLKNIR